MGRPLLLLAAVAVALAAIFALGAAAPNQGARATLDSHHGGEPAVGGDLGNSLLTTAPSRLVTFQFVSI